MTYASKALSLVAALATLAAALLPAPVTAQGYQVSGKYGVGITRIIVNSANDQNLTTYIWYPARKATAGTATHKIWNVFDSYGVWNARRLPGKKYPLVVYSHGEGLEGFFGAAMAAKLAANGFVVAAPTHFGSSLLDDDAVRGQLLTMSESYLLPPEVSQYKPLALQPSTILSTRPRDLSAVISALFTKSFVNKAAGVLATGHDLGGATAMVAAGARYASCGAMVTPAGTRFCSHHLMIPNSHSDYRVKGFLVLDPTANLLDFNTFGEDIRGKSAGVVSPADSSAGNAWVAYKAYDFAYAATYRVMARVMGAPGGAFTSACSGAATQGAMAALKQGALAAKAAVAGLECSLTDNPNYMQDWDVVGSLAVQHAQATLRPKTVEGRRAAKLLKTLAWADPALLGFISSYAQSKPTASA